MVAAIESLNAGIDHPYYSLENRFVGFNSSAEGGMNEGTIVSQVGTTQTPTPESTPDTLAMFPTSKIETLFIARRPL